MILSGRDSGHHPRAAGHRRSVGGTCAVLRHCCLEGHVVPHRAAATAKVVPTAPLSIKLSAQTRSMLNQLRVMKRRPSQR
jgi:hypothetical protein